MIRRLAPVVALAAAAAGGYLAGSFRAARPDGAVRTPAPARAAVERAVAEAQPTSLTAGEVRAIVREELSAHDAAGVGDRRPVADVAPPAPAPESDAAASRGRDVVTAAIDRGRWTPADREALRLSLGAMTRTDAEACLSEFHVALNEGRIRYEGDGLPPL